MHKEPEYNEQVGIGEEVVFKGILFKVSSLVEDTKVGLENRDHRIKEPKTAIAEVSEITRL